MKIALLQTDIIWENPAANRKILKQKIDAIATKVDLIVLPEMFTTGFTMNPTVVAETMNGETVLWLKNIAQSKKSAIVGSTIIIEDNKYYNRLLFVFPDGAINFYDKNNLFTPAGEDKIYTAGTQKIVVDFMGFRICPLICYDLRFPVFCANNLQYDLLIFVANWPEIRINAWNILLPARAVENKCYTIGVNRFGFDDLNYNHNGCTQAIDCLGNYLLTPQEYEGVFILNLNK